MSDGQFLDSIDKRLISLSKEVSGINKGLLVLARIEGTQMGLTSDVQKLESRVELLEFSIEPVKLAKRVVKYLIVISFTAFITTVVSGVVSKNLGVDGNGTNSTGRASSVATREAPIP